ncbi:hypothetical protein Ahia01_001369100, partial [Argonauta hians]
QSYLLIGPPQKTFRCCGYITSWEVFVKHPGTVRLQVWRPNNNNNSSSNNNNSSRIKVGVDPKHISYRLRGQNELVISPENTDRLVRLPINLTESITVQTGDVMGWSNLGRDMIPYSHHGASGTTILKTSMLPHLSVTDSFLFASEELLKDRNYAVRANITPGGIFLNSTIPEYVYSVKLTIRVTDTCGLYSDGVLEIRFNEQELGRMSALTDVHFQFHNLPYHVDIREDTRQETLLRKFNVTGTPIGRTTSCLLSNATRWSRLFLLKQTSPIKNTYELYLRAQAQLLYTRSSSHVAEITCFNGRQMLGSSVTVHLVKNKPPVVHNLPASLRISSKVASIGSQLYVVNVTDPEGDTPILTMDCSNKHCPFLMSASGVMSSIRSLESVTSPIFDLQVSVSDPYNQEGPYMLTVFLTDLNNPPTISPRGNTTLYVKENTAKGEVIFKLKGSDFDSDLLHFMWKFHEDSGSSYFTLNESGEISPVLTLDYEGMTSHEFNVTVWVTDGIGESNPLHLYIKVVDINEPPQFSAHNYSISVYENSAGVVVIPNTLLQVYDQDAVDQERITFKISGGKDSLNFNIDPYTGEVSFAVNYDVRMMPSHVTLNVTASDSAGLNCTTTMELFIKPLNWKPYLNNLPWQLAVPETSVATGLPLYVITSFDADTTDPVHFRASFYPPIGASKFYLNYTTGAVSLVKGEQLDFETGPRLFVLEVIVNDGSIDSIAANLSINIINTNEAPQFKHHVYYVEATQPKKGFVLMKAAQFGVTDPDDDVDGGIGDG